MEFSLIENGESLKKLRPSEAINHTYQEIKAHPDKEADLVSQLTGYFFETKPSVGQVKDAFFLSTMRLASMLNSYQDRIEQIISRMEKPDERTISDLHDLVNEMNDVGNNYKSATKPLEIYCLSAFQKTPEQIYLAT